MGWVGARRFLSHLAPAPGPASPSDHSPPPLECCPSLSRRRWAPPAPMTTGPASPTDHAPASGSRTRASTGAAQRLVWCWWASPRRRGGWRVPVLTRAPVGGGDCRSWGGCACGRGASHRAPRWREAPEGRQRLRVRRQLRGGQQRLGLRRRRRRPAGWRALRAAFNHPRPPAHPRRPTRPRQEAGAGRGHPARQPPASACASCCRAPSSATPPTPTSPVVGSARRPPRHALRHATALPLRVYHGGCGAAAAAGLLLCPRRHPSPRRRGRAERVGRLAEGSKCRAGVAPGTGGWVVPWGVLERSGALTEFQIALRPYAAVPR